MPIKKSIEDLPYASQAEGNPPSKNPWVARTLLEAWADAQGDGEYAHALPEAGPYRASYASQRCDRALVYKLRGDEPTNPFGLATIWRFGQGTLVHDSLQALATHIWDCEPEANVDLNSIGIPGSAHADLIINKDGKRIVVEIKTVGGFAFKQAAFDFKGVADGPKEDHVLQPAMINAAIGGDGVIVLYVGQENVSAQIAKSNNLDDVGKCMAEWHFSTEQLQPLVDAEVGRIQAAVAVAKSNAVPVRLLHSRQYAKGAVVTNPENGAWVVTDGRDIVDSGSAWNCGYCDFRDRCIEEGA